MCAFGWKGLASRSPEQQNESARLLGALAGQSRSKATAAPPSNEGGTSVSTGSDAIIELAKCDLNVRLSPNSGRIADVAALRICAMKRHCASQKTVTEAALVQRDKRVCHSRFGQGECETHAPVF
jgi:hypothetical protein